MAEEKTLPEGTDLSEFNVDLNLKSLVFEYNGKAWEYWYTSVLWDVHWKAVEESWELDAEAQDVNFNIKKYYSIMLPKHIKAIPGGGALLPEMLDEWDSEIIAKLATVVPSPMLDREGGNVKKEPRLAIPPIDSEDIDQS